MKESNRLNLISFPTSLGWMGILISPIGLRKIILPQKSKEELISKTQGWDYLDENCDLASCGDLPQRLKRYLSGEKTDYPDKLDLTGATPFQQRVWSVVRTIPYGETRSYAWIAGQSSSPDSARAVGQAMAKNPLPIVIPCHRVISSNGSLGGFAGELIMKKYLLDMEAARVKDYRVPSAS